MDYIVLVFLLKDTYKRIKRSQLLTLLMPRDKCEDFSCVASNTFTAHPNQKPQYPQSFLPILNIIHNFSPQLDGKVG